MLQVTSWGSAPAGPNLNRYSACRRSFGNRRDYTRNCFRNRGRNAYHQGSGFQSGATVAINGKAANVKLKDANTLLVVTPGLTAGPQQITITNPDGGSVSLDAAFTAN